MSTSGIDAASSRVDVGRVCAVTLFSLLLFLNGQRLLELGAGDLQALVNSTLTLAFYVMLVVAYLRRGPARKTDRHGVAWAAALIATWCPFLLPFVSDGPRTGGTLSLLGSGVLLVGLVAMLWALGALGTNISIVPQAREVVTHGPYAHVRHPLYAAEMINMVGVCLAMSGAGPWLVLVMLAALQVVRARREERLLLAELPGYADYRNSTPMLVPSFHPR